MRDTMLLSYGQLSSLFKIGIEISPKIMLLTRCLTLKCFDWLWCCPIGTLQIAILLAARNTNANYSLKKSTIEQMNLSSKAKRVTINIKYRLHYAFIPKITHFPRFSRTEVIWGQVLYLNIFFCASNLDFYDLWVKMNNCRYARSLYKTKK